MMNNDSRVALPRIQDADSVGVLIAGRVKGRLEGCEVWGSKQSNVQIEAGADPFLSSCK